MTGGNGAACTGLPSYTVSAFGSPDVGSGLAGYAYETSAGSGAAWSTATQGASFTAADTHSGATLLVPFQAIDAAGNGSAFTVPGPASTITLC